MAKHQAEEFFSIDVASLRVDEAITFEVYLYLPLNEHVIKLLNIAEKIETAFLERFQKRGIRQLHVRNSDHASYMKYIAAKAPAQAPSAPTASAPAAAMPAAIAATPNVPPPEPPAPPPVPFTPPVEPEKVMKGLLSSNPEETKKATEEAQKVIDEILAPTEDNETAEMVANAENDHANSVAVYSVLFAMGIGVKDKVLLQDFVTASMLHDIGLSQVPPSVACIPMATMQGNDLIAYQAHAAGTLSVVDELQFKLSPRARLILEQHHEKFNGTGYPKRLEGFRIADNAQILGLAELVDSMCRGFYDGSKHSLDEAIAMVCKIEKQTTFPCFFNPDLFKKIMNWIKKGSGLDYIAQAESVVKEAKDQILNKAA